MFVLPEEHRAGDYVIFWLCNSQKPTAWLFPCVCTCVVAGSGTTTVTLLHDSDFQLRNVPSLYHLLARTAPTETRCERPTKRCYVNEIMSKTVRQLSCS